MSKSLYDRLAGAPGISGLVDDVIAAHLENPLVRPRFQYIKAPDHTRKMAREFFVRGLGWSGKV